MRKKDLYKKINYPVSVRKRSGTIGAENISDHKGSLIIRGGEYVVYDMGAASVGGYPVFNVKSFDGNPKLHISYSDRFSTYEKEDGGYNGDFGRDTCKYLGVELPVMPGNPYRREDYSINRTGEYVYPLVQGQERFVYISVSGTSEDKVELSDFYVYDNSIDNELYGEFCSDNRILDKIYLAGARTIRLATINAMQFENVNGKLLLRKLTKSPEKAVLKGLDLKKAELEAEFELSLNPEHSTGVGVAIFSDGKSGYELTIEDSGRVLLKNGNETLFEGRTDALKDNFGYTLKVSADEHGITARLDGKIIVDYKDIVKTRDSVGFCMKKEWRAVIDKLKVVADGKEYEDAINCENYNICESGYFISDGAKRDRLPWTGDLDWAFGSGFYCFGGRCEAVNTLKVLGFNRNPEGYIYATEYPENTVKPERNEYGYYQSDMFSAWYVVSALTYYRLSGDLRVKDFYEIMKNCADYLWDYVDKKDYLFDQRFETSKGLWDHKLGDVGKNAYTNLIICDMYKNLGEFAEEIGFADDGDEFLNRHSLMTKAINEYLYDAAAGGFIKKVGTNELCDLANPYAMAKKMVTAAQAKQIAAQAEKITHCYGKIIALMAKGLYEYGYKETAEKLLFGKHALLNPDGSLSAYVDWVSAVDNDDLPETVYECMHNPPIDFGAEKNWGDLSHPDSAISDIIATYIGGIRNIGTGFDKVLIKPEPYECKKAKCGVPTKFGYIELSYETTENETTVILSVPDGIEVVTDFSAFNKKVIFKKTGGNI